MSVVLGLGLGAAFGAVSGAALKAASTGGEVAFAFFDSLNEGGRVSYTSAPTMPAFILAGTFAGAALGGVAGFGYESLTGETSDVGSVVEECLESAPENSVVSVTFDGEGTPLCTVTAPKP